jgi:ApaG protein
MYSATTRNIRVTVEPVWLDDESRPGDDHFVWAYHVKIENKGAETVTLRHRYWRITDALGRVLEVRGAGVIGEQPTLQPGGAFEYTSGAPLETPSAIIVGSYEMENNDGESFNVAIPAFSLDCPWQPASIN